MRARSLLAVLALVLLGATLAGQAQAGAALEAARALFEDRQLPGAIDAAARAIAAEPRNPEAHVLAGLVAEIIGDLEAAEAAYSRALELDADNEAARRGLFRIDGDGSAEEAGFEILQGATGFSARNSHRTGLLIPLDTDSADDPQLLGFTPLGTNPAVGILRWYSGSPGTSYLTPIVRARLVDLTLGTWSESVIDEALDERAEWTFRGDRAAVVSEPGGEVVAIRLPGRAVGPRDVGSGN
ncbi:MAG: hypothetical protein KDI98_03780 [Hyphomicrobiaceae bacterium]|nr:hypothetical protein [Hyphomicrobiaceae bacterium]